MHSGCAPLAVILQAVIFLTSYRLNFPNRNLGIYLFRQQVERRTHGTKILPCLSSDSSGDLLEGNRQ